MPYVTVWAATTSRKIKENQLHNFLVKCSSQFHFLLQETLAGQRKITSLRTSETSRTNQNLFHLRVNQLSCDISWLTLTKDWISPLSSDIPLHSLRFIFEMKLQNCRSPLSPQLRFSWEQIGQNYAVTRGRVHLTFCWICDCNSCTCLSFDFPVP